jgi:hypothetical protein
MKFDKPINENYCATVVTIKHLIPLENCDNIQATIIFGNSIIISKDTKVGDVGIYFPAETQLSDEYTKANNLYRHSEKNIDPDKKGYIEDNRRIRTMKMRGNQSCGLFMPLDSVAPFVDITLLNEGDSFDKIGDTPICQKYISHKQKGLPGSKQSRKKIKQSKLIENQFNFHTDTSQLGKNVHVFKENDIVSITYKMHGTSVIISKLICKKKINIFLKLLRLIGIKIVDTEYDNIYASRRVIKNDDMKMSNHFYDVDIWGMANEKIKDFLMDGMTIYAEIVGYLPTGAGIQSGKGKVFDYGCAENCFEVYIYRITYTNTHGDVFEFSAKQVQDWCKERGLNAVPELFYGKIGDVIYDSQYYDNNLSFGDNILNVLRNKYLEKKCFMCKNNLPAEGIVVRKETNGIDAFKFKSFAFLKMETEELDKGTEDIEEEN